MRPTVLAAAAGLGLVAVACGSPVEDPVAAASPSPAAASPSPAPSPSPSPPPSPSPSPEPVLASACTDPEDDVAVLADGPPGSGEPAGPDAPLDLAEVRWDGDETSGDVELTFQFHDPIAPVGSSVTQQVSVTTAWPAVGDEPGVVLLLIKEDGPWRAIAFDEATAGSPFGNPPPEGASDVVVDEEAGTLSITFPLASLRGDQERFLWIADSLQYDASSRSADGFGDSCGDDPSAPGEAGQYDYPGHVTPPRDLEPGVEVDG